MSAFATMFHGAPDFFSPRTTPPVSLTGKGPMTLAIMIRLLCAQLSNDW